MPASEHDWSKPAAIAIPFNDPAWEQAACDASKAELVKLRYFVGMTIKEAADALGISEPTANRWWAYARTWLQREIEAG